MRIEYNNIFSFLDIPEGKYCVKGYTYKCKRFVSGDERIGFGCVMFQKRLKHSKNKGKLNVMKCKECKECKEYFPDIVKNANKSIEELISLLKFVKYIAKKLHHHTDTVSVNDYVNVMMSADTIIGNLMFKLRKTK